MPCAYLPSFSQGQPGWPGGMLSIPVLRRRQEERTQALQWLAAHGAVFDATQMYKTFNLATATSA